MADKKPRFGKASDLPRWDPSKEGKPCVLCGGLCTTRDKWPAPELEWGDYFELGARDVEVFGQTIPGFVLCKMWICELCRHLLDRVFDMFDGGGRPGYALVGDEHWGERVPAFIEAFRDLGIFRDCMMKGPTPVAAALRVVRSEYLQMASLLEAVLEQLPDEFEKDIRHAAKRIVNQDNIELQPGAPKPIFWRDLFEEEA